MIRKFTLIFAALIFFVSTTAAVAYGNGASPCSEGAMCTMTKDAPTNTSDLNQSSEPANYTVKLTVNGKSCATNSSRDIIHWGDYHKMESMPPTHRIEFNGTVISENPCKALNYSVSKEGGIYTLNIYTENTDQACSSCLGAIQYIAEFQARTEYFQVNVQHNGEDMKSFAPPQKINEGGLTEKPQSDESQQPEPEKSRGPLTSLLDWLFNILL